MSTPRTEVLGKGIRTDHVAACKRSGRRCACPKSWAKPTVGGVALGPRTTGFIGTFTEALHKKAKEADQLRGRHTRQLARATEPRNEGSADETYYSYSKRWITNGRSRGWAPDTVDGRKGRYRNHLHKMIGKCRLHELTGDLLERVFLAAFNATPHKRTLLMCMEDVRTCLNTAVKKRILDHNPVLTFNWPEYVPEERRDWLSWDDYEQLLEACERVSDRLKIRISVQMARRRGELTGLRWNYFDGHLASITHAARYEKGNGTVLAKPKGKKTAYSALGPTLLAELEEHKRNLFKKGLYRHDGFLWPGGNRRNDPGRPLSPDTMGKDIKKLIIRAGLVDADGDALYTGHDLRRTGLTLAAASGVSEEILRDQAAHSDIAVTREFYLRNKINPRLHEFAAVFE